MDGFSFELFRFKFLIIQIQLLLSKPTSYFNLASELFIKLPFMVTLPAVISIASPEASCVLLTNNVSLLLTVKFSLKVDVALFVKLAVFTAVPYVLSIDNVENAVELSITLNAVFVVLNITSIVHKLAPSK